MAFNKIKLITSREYITRVRKKSFIIMTILGPVLMALTVFIPVWVASMKDTNVKKIAVIDYTHKMAKVLGNTETLTFEPVTDINIENYKKLVQENTYYAVLTITDTTGVAGVKLYTIKQPGIEVTNYIKRNLENEIEQLKLKALGINKEQIKQTETSINLEVLRWDETGTEQKSYTELAMAIGYIGAILIYMFVFIYGAQVMRGVIEEKTSRVVEIIVSSVKPFELMMGKILGIALVALTQFSIWVIAIIIIFNVVKPMILGDLNPENVSQNITGITPDVPVNNQPQSEMADVFNAITNIDYPIIMFTFIFYFIGGYLLYASLFAAIGSAVDNETDTQQFMLPISLPLILAFVIAQAIIQNPEGQVAFWFSMIPLTSPVIMMVRVAFGVPEAVPYWQLILSMVLLVLTFIGTTWLAAKIYRTGILMYGKKISYKELWKWIRYKN